MQRDFLSFSFNSLKEKVCVANLQIEGLPWRDQREASYQEDSQVFFFFFFFGEFMPGVGYSLSCSEFPFCYEYFLAPFFSSPLVIGSTYWSFSRDLTTQSPLQLHVVTRLNVNQWDRRGNNICNPRSHFLFPSFCSWDNCLCKGIIRASPSAIKCSPQDIP